MNRALGMLGLCARARMLVTGENPINIYATIWSGSFGSPRRIWAWRWAMAAGLLP